MEQHNFKKFTVYHCPICFSYKQTELECEHDFVLILFELSNGSLQLRNYCKLCHYRDSHIISQKGYDISKIPVKQESSFTSFIGSIYNDESEERKLFISGLREKQQTEFYKKYTDYINSEKWQTKRNEIIFRDKFKCQICGVKANDVHHLSYAHFESEYGFELVSLCNECHINEYHSKQAKEKINGLNIPNK